MRQLFRFIQRRIPTIQRASSVGAGVGIMLLGAPAHAQTASATTASAAWVTATMVSVAAVLMLWITASGVFQLARRLHWVSPHRHSRLSRGLQVTFGGLLLTAVLMPYLAMNHPLVATGLCISALVTSLAIGSGRWRWAEESQSPPSHQ